ncbi:MAG TPA: hypothetical protein PKB02_19165 [Anaerohalosphaeraceae bacterium]|nr:hypothetical protein [Anaerohalosphaeraceae bacterium]
MERKGVVGLALFLVVCGAYASVIPGYVQWDIYPDGIIDSRDLLVLSENWLAVGYSGADIAPAGGDGIVNMQDFAVLSSTWETYTSAAMAAAYEGRRSAFLLTQQCSESVYTYFNSVQVEEAHARWNDLYNVLALLVPGGAGRFSDNLGEGDEIVTDHISCDSGQGQYKLRFYRYDSDVRTILLDAWGFADDAAERVTARFAIRPEKPLANCAIAARGRIWIGSQVAIRGGIYSSWNKASLSPFQQAEDSCVAGCFNTVLTVGEILEQPWRLEKLDTYESYDTEVLLLGGHDGIRYGVDGFDSIPGLSIDDYDTSMYKNAIPNVTKSVFGSVITDGKISTSGVTKVREYFPHTAESYSRPAGSGSRTLERYKYENKTFRNVLLNSNNNALFKNCTFEDVLYIDCSTNASSYYNNVRFENCTFKGIIVTNTPSSLNWRANCLYFTGINTFDTISGIAGAAILAPNFDINLGTTNPVPGESIIVKGSIVGGIVDIRCDAQIYGTITAMADTTSQMSGFVNNIGATLEDGGSETTEVTNIGTIEIIPAAETLLPSGIRAKVVLVPIE